MTLSQMVRNQHRTAHGIFAQRHLTTGKLTFTFFHRPYCQCCQGRGSKDIKRAQQPCQRPPDSLNTRGHWPAPDALPLILLRAPVVEQPPYVHPNPESHKKIKFPPSLRSCTNQPDRRLRNCLRLDRHLHLCRQIPGRYPVGS